ncbi:MAG: hypothetical protein LUI39_13050 [Lachnospiraceae bacterium]|nr:hypothetical protein [Lachnospiraceae bacterium]
MSVVIHESDMDFGVYEDDQVFQIEKCQQYQKSLKPNGIKSCEFILRKGNKLYFVEAKTSCPQQINTNSSEEKIKKYQDYVSDILLKMRHSLNLYSAILFSRYSNEGISKTMMDSDLSDLEIRLVLVVKNAEKEWLAPFVDVFNKALYSELQIWKPSRVFVMNESTAKQKGLIAGLAAMAD